MWVTGDVPVPGQRLAAPRRPLQATSVLLASSAPAILGTGMIGGHPAVGGAVSVLVLASSARLAWLGHRDAARRQLHDWAAESLAPRLGLASPTRKAVRIHGWSGHGRGVPRRVRMYYAAQTRVGDPVCWTGSPEWKSTIAVALQELFGADYAIAADPGSRWIEYGLAPPSKQPVDLSDIQQTAARILTDMVPSLEINEWAMDDTGGLLEITATHDAVTRLAPAGYRRRIEAVFDAVVPPGRWHMEWDLLRAGLKVRRRGEFPSSLWLPADLAHQQQHDLLATYDQVRICLGDSEQEEKIWWHPALHPNLLVTGPTGSGKTSAMHSILVQFAGAGWPVWIADGKGTEFLGFADWPNVQIVGSTTESHVAIISRAHELMKTRYDAVVNGLASEEDFEPVLVIIDEFSDMLPSIVEWYAGVKPKGGLSKPPVLSLIGSMARKARTSRVHLVFALQRADQAFFPAGDVRENFPAKLAIGRTSPQSSMMMWGSPAVGVTVPRNVRGRANAMGPDNMPLEVQTHRVPDPRRTVPDSEDAARLDGIRPPHGHTRLIILPPEQTEADKDAGIPLTYPDYERAPWDHAAHHPEIDPVVARQSAKRLGREATSTLASLGLAPQQPEPSSVVSLDQKRLASTKPAPVIATTNNEHSQLREAQEAIDEIFSDDETGWYGEPEATRPTHLNIGDLVLLGEDWVVVDEDPTEDPIAPDHVCIAWSGEGDAGCESLSRDDLVRVRRPNEK